MWPLVLDVAWRVDVIRDCPAPGGEPLWRVADGPAIVVSALNPTKKCRNRRLPGLTQCNDFICGSESFTPGRKAANRWVIPGSRLFLHVSAGLVLRRNSRGWKGSRLSGSPPGAGQSRVASTCHATIEDENEDDYDFTRRVRLGERTGVANDRRDKSSGPFAKAFTPFGSLALPKNPQSRADPRS